MDQQLKKFITCQANSGTTASLKATSPRDCCAFEDEMVSKTEACTVMNRHYLKYYKYVSKIFKRPALFGKFIL